MNQVKIASMAIITTLVLIAGCAPSPEQYASATATVASVNDLGTKQAIDNDQRRISNDALATTVAGAYKATATSDANSAMATSTVIAISVQGTAQAIQQQITQTVQAGVVLAEQTKGAATLSAQATQTILPKSISTGIVQQETNASWLQLAFVYGVVGLIVFAMIAIGISAWVRRHADTLPRDETGQLPGYTGSKPVTDVSRAIGPVAGAVNTGMLWDLWNAWQVFRHAKAPESKWKFVDPKTIPPELQLAAVQSANAVSATAAAMRPQHIKGDEVTINDSTAARRDSAMQNIYGARPSLPMPALQMLESPDLVDAMAREIEPEAK